jgi:hypothetical protein
LPKETTMQNITSTAQVIYNQTIKEIEDNYNNFLARLNEYKYGSNPYYKDTIDDVLLFVEKYFEWYGSPHKRQWLHQMFDEMIWQEADIFGPLLHFISYNIYDDGSWNVKWFKDVYETKKKVIGGVEVDWPTFENIGREETTEDDWENGYPVVVSEDVTQDPKILLRAMFKYEENKKKEAEYYENLHRKNEEWTKVNSEKK